MLQCLETTVLQTRDGFLMLNLRLSLVDKFLLVFLEVAKTPNHHKVDHTEGAKLLYLVNNPSESKCDKN